MNKKVTALLIGTVVAIAGFALWIPAARAATTGCDNVAIIRCGVKSQEELLAKYDSNPNSAQTVYRAFGIERGDLNGFTNGTVYKDGRVVVNGKTVATGARTAGHNWGQGDPNRTSIPGTDAYKYSTSQLTTDARPIMVKMVNGQFEFGIMNDCGNPVSATPVPVEQPKTVTPVYTCDRLTKVQKSPTNYEFTTTASAKDGATISGYTYDFGDGSSPRKLGTDGKTASHNYTRPGTYTATVTVEYDVNGTKKAAGGANCSTSVTIAQENTLQVCDIENKTIITIKEAEYDESIYSKDLSRCDVKVCQISTRTIMTISPEDVTSDYTTDLSKCEATVTPASTVAPSTPAAVELPRTGAADVISGSLGFGTLTGAGYYYAASRRALRK